MDTIDGRRHLTFDRQVGFGDICETLTFTEGVGPSATLIFPLFRDAVPANGAAQRICHVSREGNIFYPSETETDFCGRDIVDIDQPFSVEVQLFPNPTSGVLQVRGLPSESTVYVINLQGQIMPIQIHGQQIDLSPLPNGLYFLMISADGHPNISYKIIKY